MTLGEKLSPILNEIEDTLLENENKPNFTREGFISATFIFTSAMMDKMWERQEELNLPIEERSEQATELGKILKELINSYTGIDTHKI